MKKILVMIITLCSVINVGCSSNKINQEGSISEDKVIEENAASNTASNTKSELKDSDRNYGNTINNLYKKKQICMYNNKFYYSNDNDSVLYKCDKDGENVEKLNEDNPTFINIYKDKLYYICSNNSADLKLIKVDMDGQSNREIIDTNVKSAFINNDKLLYIKIDSVSKNGYIHSTAHEVDLIKGENKQLSPDENVSVMLNEKTYIETSRGSDRYIKIDENINLPSDNSATISLLSANSEHIIVRIDSIGRTDSNGNSFDNSIYDIGYDGSIKKIIQGSLKDDDNDKGNSIIVKNKYYYFKDGSLMELDLDSNKEIKRFTVLSNNHELFEFGGIIYSDLNNVITPMYDTVNNEIMDEEKWTETDKNLGSASSSKINNYRDAENLLLGHVSKILEEEKSKLNANLKINYIGEVNKDLSESMKRNLNIDINGTAYEFDIVDDVLDIEVANYVVDSSNGNVYEIPHQSLGSGYLIKNSKKVKEYKWID
ncbi:MAG: DUF5050 domain-containing protein [Clostridium sp.]|nr:DUF5050 domain-containing protein [Clostridium sp.]